AADRVFRPDAPSRRVHPHRGHRAVVDRRVRQRHEVAGQFRPRGVTRGRVVEQRRAWLAEHDVDWCWWPLNPTQPRGTVPVTGQHRSSWGDPEPWGLLSADWRGVANPPVLDILKAMIPARTGPGVVP